LALGIGQRDDKVFKLQQGTLPTGSVFKDKRVVISVDGGRTRLRINKKADGTPKLIDMDMGEWVEPKLLTVSVDDQGKKSKLQSSHH